MPLNDTSDLGLCTFTSHIVTSSKVRIFFYEIFCLWKIDSCMLSRVQLCVCVRPTLCSPMNCSFPGSSVHGVLPDKNTEVGSHFLGFPGGASHKEAACRRRRHRRCRFGSWVRKIPWRREMATLSRILAWEHPMDRGAWWATVLELAKSRTWLEHTHAPFATPEDLPHPGIKPTSPVSPALAGGCVTTRYLGALCN